MIRRWEKRVLMLATVVACMAVHAEGNKTAAELGLMQGFPPPPDKRITRSNFMNPPYNRWALQRMRELQPTREVYRGDGRVAPLEEKNLDLGAVTGKVRDGRTLTVDQFLKESHTDSFLVMHRGKLVFERYMNGMQRHTQHQMFSATKSFVGTLMLGLIEQGRIDPTRLAGHYVPELQGSAFGDASVQQVLDMTTAVRFSEIYDDPNSDIWRYGNVFTIFGPVPASYEGPRTTYDYLPTLQKQGRHGGAFLYVTPNTDVLAWIMSRVTNKPLSRQMEEVLWQPLGVERDGYLWLDPAGTEMAGGGLSITARDAARFGQMILQRGFYNGKQVIPASVAERILLPGNPASFTISYPDEPWYGEVAYAYHDQWWTFNNAHKAVSAIGVHGQYIYLDPVANMVVVKQSSSPDAEGGFNDSNDIDGPLLYQAMAEELIRSQNHP
jgi:CubicO group peptidase (beta-lactamase class C family)